MMKTTMPGSYMLHLAEEGIKKSFLCDGNTPQYKRQTKYGSKEV